MAGIALQVFAAPSDSQSASFPQTEVDNIYRFDMPWHRHNLSESEAAEFLLDRLSFGAVPGQVDLVVEQGMDNWLRNQLNVQTENQKLQESIENLPISAMSYAEIAATFPGFSMLLAQLRRMEPGRVPHREEPIMDFNPISEAMNTFADERGYQSQDEDLQPQVLSQKIQRAVYSANQLQEVLTDFWFNHFYTGNHAFAAKVWIEDYENQVIRANALGNFEDMLQAVVKHPGMSQAFLYNEHPAEIDYEQSAMAAQAVKLEADKTLAAEKIKEIITRAEAEITALEWEQDLILEKQFWPEAGPNRIFASTIINFHTLGPDANLESEEYMNLARGLTGWSMPSYGADESWFTRGLEHAKQVGFVEDGLFLFRADRHDARPKTFLGNDYPGDQGLEEGQAMLSSLANHSKTADHIAFKFAQSFVSENPNAELVENLATNFQQTQGDIRALVVEMVNSDAFWQQAKEPQLVKSPFEYLVSALRSVDAEIENTDELAQWLERMGQPLYGYMDASGFPDTPESWLDTGSFNARIGFAQALALNEIEGVEWQSTNLDSKQDSPNMALELSLAIAGPRFQMQ